MAIQQLLAAYGAAGGGGSDPNFSSVVSLLHFDGANNSTVFTDVIGKTWTTSNATNARLSTTDPRFGTACLLLTGANISTPDSADWDFGSGDFTVEAWVRPADVGQTGAIVCQWNGGGQRAWILFQVGGNMQFSYSTNGNVQTNAFSNAASWSTTSYQHVAVSCNSGVIRGYVNGVQVGTDHNAAGAFFNSTLSLVIGDTPDNLAQWNGRIDELRITKGVGRYPSAFTPPAAPFPDS